MAVQMIRNQCRQRPSNGNEGGSNIFLSTGLDGPACQRGRQIGGEPNEPQWSGRVHCEHLPKLFADGGPHAPPKLQIAIIYICIDVYPFSYQFYILQWFLFSRLKPSWSSRNCLDLCAQLCDLAHQLHIPLLAAMLSGDCLRSLGPQNQNAMSVTIGYPIMWCYVMLCDVAWHDSDGDSDSDTDNDMYIYNQTHIIFTHTHLDLDLYKLYKYKYKRYMNIYIDIIYI